MKRLSVWTITIALCFLAVLNSASADSLTYNTALVDPPGFYNGTDNPNAGFTVDTIGNLELGLGVNLRFIGPVTPTSTNIYDVPTGAQGCCAKWNFEFSINTQAGGGSDVLSDFTYQLTIQDIGQGSMNQFDPFLISDNSYWNGSKTVAATPPADAYGAQNSENLSFAGFLPGFQVDADDTYVFTLQAFQEGAAGQELIGTNQIIVNAGAGAAVPEPRTLGFLLIPMFGFGILIRRKLQKA
jgi:hypothetical protein